MYAVPFAALGLLLLGVGVLVGCLLGRRWAVVMLGRAAREVEARQRRVVLIQDTRSEEEHADVRLWEMELEGLSDVS